MEFHGFRGKPLSLYDFTKHNVAGSSACSMLSPSPYPEFILVGKNAQIEWVSSPTRYSVQLSVCSNTGGKQESTLPQALTLACVDRYHKGLHEVIMWLV